MGHESTRQESGSEGRDEESQESGIPLGINTSPEKESHQRGNEGAGILNWRSGRGAV